MTLTDFNSLSLEDCGAALVTDAELSRLMAVTLAEDGVEAGDISTLTIVPEGRSVTAEHSAACGRRSQPALAPRDTGRGAGCCRFADWQ